MNPPSTASGPCTLYGASPSIMLHGQLTPRHTCDELVLSPEPTAAPARKSLFSEHLDTTPPASSSSSSSSSQPAFQIPTITYSHGPTDWRRCTTTIPPPPPSPTHLAPLSPAAAADHRARHDASFAAKLAIKRARDAQRDVGELEAHHPLVPFRNAAEQRWAQQQQCLAAQGAEEGTVGGIEVKGTQTLSFDALKPLVRDLVRWRVLSFYGLSSGRETGKGSSRLARMAFNTRAIVLESGVDWESTGETLRAQKATYERRRRCGVLPECVSLRGLDVLRTVKLAAEDAGMPLEQLVRAIEAFAGHLSTTGKMSVPALAQRKEWECLAAMLLEDGEYFTPSVGNALFPHERIELFSRVCDAQKRAVVTYFSVLEYGEQDCESLFCLFQGCRKERKVNFQLAGALETTLDGRLELETQILATVRLVPQEREQQSEESKGTSKRKSVTINVTEEQRTSSVSQEGAKRGASWDSQEEKEKRRKERREFHFGKENESGDEGEGEKQRKRQQSLEKIRAANERWDQEYTGSLD